MPDPYEIIGVRRDASLDEIRIAYRRSAQVLHPDRFATSSDGVRSEAARRMLQLNSAMEAIESERADEASGTGNLGSVTFTQRTPGTTVPSPTAAPPRPLQASDPRPQNTSNGSGDTRRRRSDGSRRAVRPGGRPDHSAREPEPDPAPVVPQPVASAPPAAPRLPDPAYVSSQPEPMFTPPAPAPEPEPEPAPEPRPVVPDAKVEAAPLRAGRRRRVHGRLRRR